MRLNILKRQRGVFIGVTTFLFLMGVGYPTSADETYTFIIQKQEQKKNTRWSLSEWLETRDRMRLMDLWLALHTPTPYEFFLGGEYQIGQMTSSGGYTGYMFDLAAYATIFGLEVRREASPEARWFGLFNFRFFGFHVQGTNITLHLGLRASADGSDTRNALVGLSTTFYLTRFFGIRGLWWNYFASTPAVSGAIITGSRYEAGAFIDFSFLRFYSNYYNEPETTTLGTNTSANTRSGFTLGSQIFF